MKVKIKKLPESQKGGIIVSDKNDPRYKSYQDSLQLYNLGKKNVQGLENTGVQLWGDNMTLKDFYESMIPYGSQEEFLYNNGSGSKKDIKKLIDLQKRTGIQPVGTYKLDQATMPAFKKPVQEVTLQQFPLINNLSSPQSNINIDSRPYIWDNVSQTGTFPVYGQDNKLIGTWDQDTSGQTNFYPKYNPIRQESYTQAELKDLPKNTKIIDTSILKMKNIRKGQNGLVVNPDIYSSIAPNMVSFLGESLLELNRPRNYSGDDSNPFAFTAASFNIGNSLLKGISGSILDLQKQKESQRVAAENLRNNFTNNPYNNFYGKGNTYFQDGGLNVLDNKGQNVRFDPFKYNTIEEAQQDYLNNQENIDSSNIDVEQSNLNAQEQNELDQEEQENLSWEQEQDQYYQDNLRDILGLDINENNFRPSLNMSNDQKIKAFAKIELGGKQIGDHGNGAIDAFGYRKSGHLSEAWKTPEYKGIRAQFNNNYNAFYETLKSGKTPEINNINNQLYSNWLESKYPGDIVAQAKFNLTGNAYSPDNTIIGKNLSAGSYANKILKAITSNDIAKKQNGGLVKTSKFKYQLGGSKGNISSIFTKDVNPNIEWEKGEHILLPNGISFHQTTGNKHSNNPENSGVKAEVPDNTFIFSDHLKVPQNIIRGFLGKDQDDKLTKSEKKYSFADIAKKFETSTDIENSTSEDKFKSNSSKLNLLNKQPKLDELKIAQELYKKGMGMENDYEKLISLQMQPKTEFNSIVSDNSIPKAQAGGYNTFSPDQVQRLKDFGTWDNGDYWNKIANNLQQFGYTGGNDAQGVQQFISQQYPQLVNYAFNQGYWPNTNKGINNYGDVSANTLTPDQQLDAFNDNLRGVRAPLLQKKQFNNQEEYDNWIAEHTNVPGTSFYDTRQGNLVNYTMPNLNLDSTINPSIPVNPNSPQINTPPIISNNIPNNDMPYNQIDLSGIRNAEAISLMNSLRPSKINYPNLRELPTLEQPVLLDQVPIANSTYNKAIGNALSQVRNSNLTPQERMVASSNVIAKSLDDQPNSELYTAQQNLINNNINRTNSFNQDVLNLKNQMLDKYQAQVNSVYAGKEKNMNQRLNSISRYIGNEANRNLEIQQWMSQTGADYYTGPDGNIYFRPNKTNSLVQGAYQDMLQFLSGKNPNVTTKK